MTVIHCKMVPSPARPVATANTASTALSREHRVVIVERYSVAGLIAARPAQLLVFMFTVLVIEFALTRFCSFPISLIPLPF